MKDESQKRIALGMAEVIKLMQAKGYSPRETQWICLSISATIAINYLKVPMDKMQQAMDVFGEVCGINLAYRGAFVNPSQPEFSQVEEVN